VDLAGRSGNIMQFDVLYWEYRSARSAAAHEVSGVSSSPAEKQVSAANSPPLTLTVVLQRRHLAVSRSSTIGSFAARLKRLDQL
jgi:hypothetical protein